MTNTDDFTCPPAAQWESSDKVSFEITFTNAEMANESLAEFSELTLSRLQEAASMIRAEWTPRRGLER